ncbi:hypothetical protein B0H10DRAFT_2161644 [Mycena sp. CBHHK59/15]|nr:hypothetical protein B0H10DRAFT_2161644 [Mycena sp. CBHHK59/15]
MHSTLFAVLALSLPNLLSASPLSRRAVDFVNPTLAGGSFLDKSAGLGEPLNVIISAQSSPEVLTPSGFIQYAQVIGFNIECLGLHLGNPQSANLGDGRGDEVLRESFGIPGVGTCLESLTGGNHFRVFPQGGTGALFLAVSKEEDVSEQHNIVPNGYTSGATRSSRMRSFTTYKTVLTELTGLLAPGSDGVNHGIAQDGVVKMLTVTIK